MGRCTSLEYKSRTSVVRWHSLAARTALCEFYDFTRAHRCNDQLIPATEKNFISPLELILRCLFTATYYVTF